MSSRLEEIKAVRDSQAAKGKAKLAEMGHVQLSYWKLSTYYKCPQQYLLHCIARDFEEDFHDDNFWAITGSVVHGLFEDFIKDAKHGSTVLEKDKDFLLDNAAARYDKFVSEERVDWDAQRVDPDEYRKSAVPGILKSLDWTYEELFRMGVLPRDPALLHPEYSFKTYMTNSEGKTLPLLLTGRVDLVVEPTPSEPQHLRIVDYKDVAKDNSNSLNWRQLVWYPMGIEPIFGLPCKESGFLLTHLRKWKPKNPDAINARDKQNPKRSFRDILRAEILEMALKIRRDTFPAKTSRHHCFYCPQQKNCPEFYQYAGRQQELLADLDALHEGAVKFD